MVKNYKMRGEGSPLPTAVTPVTVPQKVERQP